MNEPNDIETLAVAKRVMDLLGQPGGAMLVHSFTEREPKGPDLSLEALHPCDIGQIAQLAERLDDLEGRPVVLEWPLRWGKATAAWTTGNTVTLDPCTFEGTDLTGAENISAYLVSPSGDAPDSTLSPEIALNDVLAYVAFTDATGTPKGVIVNAKWVVVSGAFNGAQASWWTRVTQNGTRTLSAADWRGREYWISIVAYAGTEAAADAANDWVPTGDYATRFFIGSTNAANTQISGLTSGVFQADRVYVDGTDTGKLKLTCTDFEAEHQVVVHLVSSQQHTGKDGTI